MGGGGRSMIIFSKIQEHVCLLVIFLINDTNITHVGVYMYLCTCMLVGFFLGGWGVGVHVSGFFISEIRGC